MGRPGPTAGEGRAAANRRPKWPAGGGSLPYFFGRKEIEKRKRKRGLEKEFAHADNFPGLTKMSLIQEK